MPIGWMRNGGIIHEVTKMQIEYRDEIGIVTETVDEDGVSFCDGKAYFNDKTVEITALVSIREV